MRPTFIFDARQLLRAMLLDAVLFTAALAIPQAALAGDEASTDALTGRWELNLSKSKYEPGPAPKSAVRIQHVEGDALKVALEIILTDGQSGDATYTARLDGKDHPAGKDPEAGTIAWTRLGARTLEYRRKRAGQTIETGRLQVSEDGQEMTLATKGVNAEGQEFNHVIVYDRWQTS